MNPQGRIPRRRGAVCGLLLILLGLWGGLAPFVGPYLHFGYTPDKTWDFSSGRLYYSVIPAAAVLLGGLLAVAVVGIDRRLVRDRRRSGKEADGSEDQRGRSHGGILVCSVLPFFFGGCILGSR